MHWAYFTSWLSACCCCPALIWAPTSSRWLQTWLAAVSWLLTGFDSWLPAELDPRPLDPPPCWLLLGWKSPLLSGSGKSGTPWERMHLAYASAACSRVGAVAEAAGDGASPHAV